MARQSFDWPAHCAALHLDDEDLAKVADSLNFSVGNLTPRQSQQLLKALKKYAAAKGSDAIAQQNLF